MTIHFFLNKMRGQSFQKKVNGVIYLRMKVVLCSDKMIRDVVLPHIILLVVAHRNRCHFFEI
jgi:hypothetical protein